MAAGIHAGLAAGAAGVWLAHVVPDKAAVRAGAVQVAA